MTDGAPGSGGAQAGAKAAAPSEGAPGTAAATASRARAGRDIAGQVVLRAINLALGVGVTLLLVRALGTDGFGRWSVLLAVIGFVSYFGSLGLAQVAVERAAADPERAPDWFGALLTLRLALIGPVTLLSLGVCLALADDTAMRVAAVLVCTTIPIAVLSSLSVVFQLQVRNVVVTAIELGNAIVWAAAVVVVALLDGGLVAYAAAFLAVATITNTAYIVLALRASPVHLRGARRLWGDLLRQGLPVGIGGLLTLGYGYVDQVIVFEVAGVRDAGLYGAVYRIYERVQFLPAAIMTTLFPVFVSARDRDPARVKRLFRSSVDYLLLTSLPAFTITLAGAEPITRLLFGEDFIDAAPALPLLMATFVVVSLGYLTGYLIVAYNLQRRFLAIGIGALVFNVATNLALVPSYGFMAAAWLTLATEVLVMSLSMWIVCARMGIAPMGDHLGRIAIAAAAAGLLAWGLSETDVPTVVWLALASAAYAGLVVALGAVKPAELRALVSRGDA
jgi:O-antigen/teichoic acid export membrane protein